MFAGELKLLGNEAVKVVTGELGDGGSLLQLGPEILRLQPQIPGCGRQALGMACPGGAHGSFVSDTNVTTWRRARGPAVTDRTTSPVDRRPGIHRLWIGTGHRYERNHHRGGCDDDGADHQADDRSSTQVNLLHLRTLLSSGTGE